MNDGKCDTAGRFWFGSMSLNEKDPTANLWMLDNDLKLHHKLSGCTISNGIAWDKARKHMYYIDTPTNRVDVFDYEHDTGVITNRREAFKNIWGGHFDGMTIDADDNLYIGLWAGAKVIKVSTTGELLANISLPEVANVTSCTFAGADLQILYITTAKSKDVATQPRNAGKLFKIKFPDAKGLAAAVFVG
jgi:sugar lactone lactonase YvrE